MADEWTDISRPVDETLTTWPGRARPERRWEKSLAAGDHCNVSAWEWSSHAGTHMDAPLHFVANGRAIDQIPTEFFFGEIVVAELAGEGREPMDETVARRYAGARRLLFKTAHSRTTGDGAYESHDALMTKEAAKILLKGGLLLIGTDRLSVDDSDGRGNYGLHRLFLGAGCVILEGLLLSAVGPGSYYLAAPPLRLTGGEASPVRALLRKRADSPPSASGLSSRMDAGRRRDKGREDFRA